MEIFKKRNEGWTLMELLIVIALIAILALIFLLVNWKRGVDRAYDARRKEDLASIRRAFEEYLNDHACYPSTDILDECGGNGLAPYLAKIPCDPVTHKPYLYKPDSDTTTCVGNRVCAQLQDWTDPDITTLGCDPVHGCGWGAYWNYCLASGTTVTSPDFNPMVMPTPVATPTPLYEGQYACVRSGNTATCNHVSDPQGAGCPRSFAQSDCLGLCGLDPALNCP